MTGQRSLTSPALPGDTTSATAYATGCAQATSSCPARAGTDPASFLLTPQQWVPQKVEFCHLVGKPDEADAFR